MFFHCKAGKIPNEFMRFFISLEIPEESKAQLKSVQTKVKSIIPQIRLTDPEKLHITIAFIGDKEESFKKNLIEAINFSVQGIPPFSLSPSYIDGFPTIHKPHIFWIGVKGDTDKLHIVRERIKDELVKLNLEVDERRYIPHIAIGKVTNFKLKEKEERELEKIMSQKFEPIIVTSIKLFESIPNHDFHSHNTLAEIKLTPD